MYGFWFGIWSVWALGPTNPKPRVSCVSPISAIDKAITWGFPKFGVPFWGSPYKDISILGKNFETLPCMIAGLMQQSTTLTLDC